MIYEATLVVSLRKVFFKKRGRSSPDFPSHIYIKPSVPFTKINNIATSLIPVLVGDLNIVSLGSHLLGWIYLGHTFGTGRFIAILRGLSSRTSSFAIVDNVIATAPKSLAATLIYIVQYNT